jgi:PAS domain S-box-containing protein
MAFHVGLVGAGRGGTSLLEMLASDERLRLIGVADPDPAAPGVTRAAELGLFTTADYHDLYRLPELDIIIEATGREEVLRDLLESRPSNVQVIDHRVARFLFEAVTLREEKAARERSQRTIIDAIPEELRVVDRDFRLVDVNEAFLRQVGLPREAVIGQHCHDVVHGTGVVVHEDHPCPLEDVFASGQASEGEFTCHCQGQARTHAYRAYPLPDAGGRVTQAVIISRDVSECKRVASELATLKQQIEFILGATKTGLDIIDADYNIRYVDPEWAKTYGDYHGKKCYEYFMDRAGVCPECGIERALAAKDVIVYEETLPKEGNRPIQVTTIPFQNERGEWLVAGVNIDITERARTEEALKEERNRALRSETLLTSLIESAQDAIIIIDTNHVVTTFNRKAEEMFGYTKEEIVGHDLSLILPSPHKEEHRARMESYVRTGRPNAAMGKTVQLEAQRHDGRAFPIEISLSETCVGQECFFTAIIRDITEKVEHEEQLKIIAEENNVCALEEAQKVREREEALEKLKQAQSQLLQSEKMAAIGQLAAGVAHEINNPVGFINSNLNTMSGYQQDLGRLLERYALLERAAADGEQAQAALLAEIASLKKDIDLEFVLEDSVNTIKESQEGVARIKDIVAALKDFSRLDQAELTSADLNEGLESTLKIVWNELKYKCTVVKELGPLPHLICHPRQLNQVFMNLLVNAAQAIEERGEIKITTRSFEGERPHLEVQIEDTGRGIPPENLPRIFEPFFTTKPVGKGTGLGLHIAYDIVAKHGGSLSVASEVGRGTTFTISLPLDGLEQAEAKGEHRDEQPPRLAS